MIQLTPQPLGIEIRFQNYLLFFGNRTSTIQALKDAFPLFYFTRIQQTHLDVVTESHLSHDLSTRADAHFSQEKNHALCVVTADCAPILVVHTQTGYIAAIHAGWRGVANQITMKTISKLLIAGVPDNEMKVFIGPHILQDSFAVDESVRNELLNSLPKKNENSGKNYFYEQNEKYHVNLYQILRQQLQSIGILEKNIFNHSLDTKTNTDYHSWRRDRELSGRQISFVVRVI